MESPHTRAASQFLRDHPCAQTLRDELIDAMVRAALAARLAEGHTQTSVAREAGIGITRLRSILSGATILDRETKPLGAWYARQPEPKVHEEAVAIGVLSHWCPIRARRAVRARIADAVIQAYEEHRVTIPYSQRAALEAIRAARLW